MSESAGHIELERSIDSIIVGVRHRKDLGDIETLARSIEEVGLLQPVTLTPDGVLVCGLRRLEAIRRLGRRTLNVWIRSGISDDLSHVLAQQAENEHHKQLSPLEQAALYREVKLLMEEDSARRQQSSRFGSLDRGASNDGAGQCPAPRGRGDTRDQASRIVTGNQSYHRLEKISWLEDVRDDDMRPRSVRNLAEEAIEQIENGGHVDPGYKRVRAADRLASTPNPPEPHEPETEDELARAAAEALKRVREEERRSGSAKNGSKSHQSPGKQPSRSPRLRTPRAFVLTWADLDGWSQWYDDGEIATKVSDEDWDRFERVVAESVEFAGRVRELRRSLPTSA